MSPLEYLASLAEQGPHALPLPKRRPFLHAHLGTLGGAAKGGEARRIAREIDRIIAPLTGSDHTSIEIEDALQLQSIEPHLRFVPRRETDDRAIRGEWAVG